MFRKRTTCEVVAAMPSVRKSKLNLSLRMFLIIKHNRAVVSRPARRGGEEAMGCIIKMITASDVKRSEIATNQIIIVQSFELKYFGVISFYHNDLCLRENMTKMSLLPFCILFSAQMGLKSDKTATFLSRHTVSVFWSVPLQWIIIFWNFKDSHEIHRTERICKEKRENG